MKVVVVHPAGARLRHDLAGSPDGLDRVAARERPFEELRLHHVAHEDPLDASVRVFEQGLREEPLALDVEPEPPRVRFVPGESVGPEGIWGALNIGAERIGHGLSAIHDPELMGVLVERQIPIEICISSNLRTGCCASLADHPVRRYFDAGLMITLNSDDPAMFLSDLECEYQLAHDEFSFTREHLRELAANSIEASFLPPERKVDLLRRIEKTA